MKVTLLKKNPKVYSSNVYLVRGDWNAIDDINTLIDVGTDDYILNELDEISTGVGKRRVEQVILTHEHFDHAGALKYIIPRFNPPVIAYAQLKGVTIRAYDYMQVKIGDRQAQILHTPGHSHDSICIYCEEERTLFSGDTVLNIKTVGGSYTMEYVESLERLSRLKIDVIYSGHDDPVTKNAEEMIKETLKVVKKSKVI